MEGLELTAFQIISMVGAARSNYIQAIQLAKTGDFSGAKSLITEGEQFFLEGHKAHSSLLQQEANEKTFHISLLLLHAEDQLMSAENFKIVAEEFIAVHKELQALKD